MMPDSASHSVHGPGRIPPWALVPVVLGVAGIVLVLWLIPGAPPGFSGQLSTLSCNGEYVDSCAATHSIPVGTNVSLEWSDLSSGVVNLWVTGWMTPPPYRAPVVASVPCQWSNASGGSCSFRSNQEFYTVAITLPSGNVTAPPQVVAYHAVYEPWFA